MDPSRNQPPALKALRSSRRNLRIRIQLECPCDDDQRGSPEPLRNHSYRACKTSAGRHLIANSTASRPDLAEIVSKPYRSKIHASSSRYSALSSTTKIKAFLFITPILPSTELLSHSRRLLLCHLKQLIESGDRPMSL